MIVFFFKFFRHPIITEGTTLSGTDPEILIRWSRLFWKISRNKKMHDEVFVQKNWVVHMNSVVNKITDNVTLQKHVKCDICYM